MLALLLGSFFLIGISTFYNFKSQNVEYHNNRLHRKEVATLISVDYYLKDIKSTINELYKTENNKELKKKAYKTLERIDNLLK